MKIILILFYQLLLSSAAAFVLGGLILLVKRIFRYRLDARWHYCVVEQVSSIEAFYPENVSRNILNGSNILENKPANELYQVEETSKTESTGSTGDTPGTVDTQKSGSGSNHYQEVLQTLFFIWLTGFILLICFTVYENIKFKSKIIPGTLCTDQRINGILDKCAGILSVKRNIQIFQTIQARAPLLYGVINPKIIISAGLPENFNDDEVLSCLDEAERKNYGQTIINLLKLFIESHFIPSTAGLIKGKSGIRRRIVMISTFKKKKVLSLIGAVALLAFIAVVGLPDAKLLANTDEVIHFKDSNIQAAVEKSLGLPAGSVVRKSHMQKIKELDIQKISDMTDMRYCTDLEALTVDSPMDLKLLKDINTLKSLSLGYNVSDLKDLKYCENLESLTVSSYTAGNTDTFPQLPRLKDLSIGFEVSNTDLSGLKRLEQLNALGLYGLNGKSNLNELGGMKQLKYLRLLRCNGLENIDSLSFLSNLQIIGKTKLTNESIQALAKFKNLKGLFIEELTIKDLKPFEKLTELESLTIMRAYITDITPLKNLTKLKTLNLAGNRIRDISVLENMKDLRNIELQVNKLENIQPLSGLSIG